MEKRDARLSQQAIAGTDTSRWNVVELESRRHLRHTIHDLIELTLHSTLSTHELQQHLHHSITLCGPQFIPYLVRTLQHSDQDEREAIVSLLTILQDQEAIPLLQHMVHNNELTRPVRLSAALALAGLGATEEMQKTAKVNRIYAIS